MSEHALGSCLLSEVMIIHLYVSWHSTSALLKHYCPVYKGFPPVIALSSLHFFYSLFSLLPLSKAGEAGIINTNLWNGLWRWEASIWVWMWLILDTLRECYHHKAKAIYLIDPLRKHTHTNTHTHTHTHTCSLDSKGRIHKNPRGPNPKNVRLLSLTGAEL